MKFPRDSFPHKSVAEWWYFNGNLRDNQGKEYAFMNCLFKTNPKKTDIPIVKRIPAKEVYFSHSLLSDLKNRKTLVRTHPLSVLSTDSLRKKNLFINYLNPSVAGYTNNEIIEIGKFKYKIKNEDIDLILTAKKKPFLHNGSGIFSLKNKKIFYYSFSNMSAQGKIKINGKNLAVKGKCWMDHEWSQFVGEKNWNWFSIQLDDNTELMIQDYNNSENLYAGIMHSNQRTEFAKDLHLYPRSFWKSPLTGASYPTEWRISIPSKKIELTTKAIIPNSEVVFGSLNYWEGPIRVSGKIESRNVNGKGFMELTGRKMSAGKVHFLISRFEKKAFSYVSSARKELRHLLNI